MIGRFLRKIIGSKNDRELKKLQVYVEKINQLEPEIRRLSDQELKAKTAEFKETLNRGATMQDILCEAFAVVRDVARRTLNMRHFDVQLMGGVVLHEGKIAEMATGEGKTLVATLPVFLNSLIGRGVHVVTVNDYLARRDSEWMGKIYRFLDLTVGTIQHGMDDIERQNAYRADVTYGTNNEFGFDYLRDNMKFSLASYVQRELNYAIVDEVDSILIDEARTPLIISGPSEDSTDKYYKINRIIPRFKRDKDYQVEEKTRTVALTEEGVAHAEKLLSIDNLYDSSNMEILHHVNQGLKSHAIFKRDVDYVVKDGEVIIVDEFTGRMMPGRRYSEGLHQALEAKEGVKIESENQTLASITFQNYFRLYNKLAGMTGTADTEAVEFHAIYNLDVVVIPTNRPLIRNSYPDVIYRTESEKFNAVVNEIKELNKKGRPVLVGTISIENSEELSRMLKKKGIRHHVLNAKYHEKEAEIVADAGQKGAVTIATNMAGRGTDIVLEDGVAGIGGLHIIGTERHESRRIDNQLRGRAGRQGDPGSSRFYLSLEDDLLRIFGSDRISGIMGRLGMNDGQPIEHKMITKAIENAQRKVEAHNFDIRKHLLEYDDVMNKQREVIYEQRREVLEGENLKEGIFEMIGNMLDNIISLHTNEATYPEEWDLEGLRDGLSRQFSVNVTIDGSDGSKELQIAGKERLKIADLNQARLKELLLDVIYANYDKKTEGVGSEMMRRIEKIVMLQIIDSLWKDHLLAMDHLKDGIGLRGYAQKDPLNEYKREGYGMFMDMIRHIEEGITEYIFKLQIRSEREGMFDGAPRRQRVIEHRGELSQAMGGQTTTVTTAKRKEKKIGRNEPCHCGSGKKYKKCCGQ
ncbi:MAG: preprotein translocase subunit SecA [Nitrospinae bacterium]|nr:preprotein translocase subunit SecA [Nitrospinota bacterium]